MPEPAPGLLIGTYRLETRLGEGGMGTVFAALDTKLNRPVAIKFLSNEFADAAARRRFQREAQLASSLNHPHILTVHDVGEFDGRQYLVTELVDGGTLKDWAKVERRSWRQIIDLLTGVADGLSAAHAAAMTHRDIKPANILVAKNGYAKLADFGLAKLEERPLGDETLTLTEAHTRPGVIIGTIAYMSPEQAAGKPTDSRSDIFSFGVVLYEQLSGHRPFSGVSELEVLKRVIHADPEPLTADVPAGLRAVVEKALEKDPADRYQSSRDMVVDLRRLTRRGEVEASVAAPPTAPAKIAVTAPKRNWRMPAVAALAAVVIVSAAAYWRLDQQDYFWKNPLEGAPFVKLTDWPGIELDASISPDGKFVSFLSNRDGVFDAYVTQLGSGDFHNLTGGKVQTLLHEMARTTGFNADSTQVWIRTPAPTLERVNLSTGVPSLSLVPTLGGPLRPFLGPSTLNPIWTADGSQLAFHHSSKGDPIQVAQPDGRGEKEVIQGRPGEHQHYLSWSPDKQWIYYVRCWRTTEADIWRVPAAGGTPEQITHHHSYVAYPVLLDNRTLIYRASKEDGSGWVLYAMDVEHRIPHQVSQGVEEYQSVSASADGRRLVVAVSNPAANLWTIPITSAIAEDAAAKQVPLPAAYANFGQYADGEILYSSGKGGANGLWKWANGVATAIWPANSGRLTYGAALSPDKKLLAFALRQNGHNVLQISNADGTRAQTLAPQLDVLTTPSWSPDSQWITTSADAGEGPRVYKISLQGGDAVQLTNAVSFNPVWSPAGDRIVFYDGDVGGATFPLRSIAPDKNPIPMPDISYRGDWQGYRFMPDGKSIIVLQGQFRAMDFWMLDLATGAKRQLTKLKPGYSIRNFDISANGKELLFDRLQENSDIALIDRH